MEDDDEHQPDLPVALARPRRHNANYQIDRFGFGQNNGRQDVDDVSL
jgi:hypothetical protein